MQFPNVALGSSAAVSKRANVVGRVVESRLEDRLAYWEEIQCNHCRPSLNYPKGIASRCQPSQQFENWSLLGDNCRLTWS